MDLVIDRKQDKVFLNNPLNGYYPLGSVSCAFGNLISLLETEFPKENYNSGDFIASTMFDLLSDKKSKKQIFGLWESGAVLYTIHHFLNGRDKIPIDPKEVESIRIENQLNTSFFPLNSFCQEDGMIFKNITSITAILYGLLYFYAYFNYKLVKCRHCGKWFVTTTFKQEYCPRNSPLPGYEHLNCEQAVRNTLQNCRRIKNRIKTKSSGTVSAQLHQSSFTNDFNEECTPLMDAAKAHPSVTNLAKYHNFLKQTEKERRWLKS